MKTFRIVITATTILFLAALIGVNWKNVTAAPDSPLPHTLQTTFTNRIWPLVIEHCLSCHNSTTQEGKLSLSEFSTISAILKNHAVWETILERVEAEEMPPQSDSKQLTQGERSDLVNWIRDLRDFEANRRAGDPGIVLARRLSNAEYDHTIRDLTGVDIRPTREFPVDPANQAGFDNSGESLTMSPALVKKYLTAARGVADHLVLLPDGFVFAPDAAVAETDRDKFCVQQIVRFYHRHDVDLADYFFACWQYKHRSELGLTTADLEDLARDFNRVSGPGDQTARPSHSPADPPAHLSRTVGKRLSGKYLKIVWKALTDPVAEGPLRQLQEEWKKLSNDVTQQAEVQVECQRLRELVVTLRKELDRPVEKLHVKGNSDGSQPLILWWNRQIADRRMRYVGTGENPHFDAARQRFCETFPNAFSITSRGLYADPNLGNDVRLLTAGFHLMQGYFRDDAPLYDLVLNAAEQAELDSLWQNLNFVTLAPIRQYKDFLFFERAEPPQFAGGPEFDFARPENKDVTSEPRLNQMRTLYLAKARENEASPAAIEAIEHYFDSMIEDVRWIEETQLSSRKRHLEALIHFAERAYRRPLTEQEREEELTFYHHLRHDDALSHEDAMRDCVASILMSPHFCFRVDLAEPDQDIQPLNDFELANRLSYFLWSSMPDEELLVHAREQNLHEPAVLLGQVHRMLQDDRVYGLATEFAGNWLGFNRFDEHNSVDRERFPAFDATLRHAMYDEPIRLFIDVAQQNRSLFDFLHSPDTFVNSVLAKHYGMPIEFPNDSSGQEWVHVPNAADFGRGGLLPMSIFLTRNSPGLRTSPVKRGYWVVRNLLGEHIPPPPPEVPELPKDEAQLGELSLPQILARHRNHQACSGCHQRFDSIGLAFEGFDPIGGRRDRDLGGRPIEAKGRYPDDVDREGLDGLRTYLAEQRRDDFVNNFCRKLLTYALGRSLLLSDQATIKRMRQSLEADDHRFVRAVEEIVTSPQFLHKRGRNPD
ncbi:DUF1592 domain-containing protein [Schlesneria sp.]|uniref:DUF1592 domain-containing protein n=1 Tax=Schlesneria sp. TaxID=2762018 RepID=UPI002EFC0BB4